MKEGNKTFAYTTPKHRVLIQMPDFVWDIFVKIVDTKMLKIKVEEIKPIKEKRQSIIVVDDYKSNRSQLQRKRGIEI